MTDGQRSLRWSQFMAYQRCALGAKYSILLFSVVVVCVEIIYGNENMMNWLEGDFCFELN